MSLRLLYLIFVRLVGWLALLARSAASKDAELDYVGRAVYRVSSANPLPAGRHQLRFEFEPTDKPDIAHGKGAPGRAQLYVDGSLVGKTDMPVTTPIMFNPGGMSCGANPAPL